MNTHPHRADPSPRTRGQFLGTIALLAALHAVTAHAAPTVSLTSPTPGQSLRTPASVTLTATASTDTGTLTKVAFYRGTTLITSLTVAPYTHLWKTSTAGSYSLTAKATDSTGKTTTSAAVPVTVVTNQAPTVNLTSPAASQNVRTGALLTLTADAQDSDGTLAKVAFYRGTTLIGTLTAAPYTYTWKTGTVGSYSLTAKATDDNGKVTTSAAVPVSVVANQAPTVSVTSPAANQSYTAPATLTLTANAQDSDGSIAKVAFYRGTSLIGTVTSPPYTYAWGSVAKGSYSLTAKATDDSGKVTTSAAVPVTVTATSATPSLSLTSPGNGAAFVAPASIPLAASPTNLTPVKVEFFQGTTLIATATSAPYVASWVTAQPGSYSLTAKATDAQGVLVTSSLISIAVLANQAPTVSLTSPANNLSVEAPATLTLTADATDPENALAKVEFFMSPTDNGTTLLGMALQAPYTFTWTGITAGSYALTAVATDALGVQTTSAPVTVTVAPKVTQLFYIHSDQLGTPRLITDSSNNPVWRNLPTTEAFGNSPPEDDPANTGNRFEFNLRFPGQYADKETGTNYNYFRDHYFTALGRYGQSDPIGLTGGINTYSYVLGNPLSYSDPSGLIVPALYACAMNPVCVEAAAATAIFAGNIAYQLYSRGEVNFGEAFGAGAMAFGATGLGNGAAGAVGKAEQCVAQGAAQETARVGQLMATHGKTMSGKKFDRLIKNIRAEGIKEPFIVTEHLGKLHVLDGNNRMLAAPRAGVAEVPINRVDLPWGAYRTPADLIYTPYGY